MATSNTATNTESQRLVQWAERRCRLLYEGKAVAHRSCGIALAETFGRRTQPYQALRKGGLTGEGMCGAITAGTLILGEVFGDPSPTGAATEELIAASARYRELWQAEVDLGRATSIVCNQLTAQFAQFRSEERHQFCTALAAATARCVAQVILEMGGSVEELVAPRA